MTTDTKVEIHMPGLPPIKTTTEEMKKATRALTKQAKTLSATDAPAESVSGKRLKSFIERIERLEGEKAGMAEDIKEVYSEAKGTGFEPRIIRKLIRLRAMDIEKRREEEELENLYKSAIGME